MMPDVPGHAVTDAAGRAGVGSEMFMDGVAVNDPAGDGAIAAVPSPQRTARLSSLLGTLISVAVLGVVLFKLGQLNVHHVLALIPRNPAFWAVFAAYYLIGPLSEWVIYRYLWGLPISGLSALVRKLVSNELLLGYLGEVQFYAWARGRLNMVAAPFGAIKDVTILSALTGNITTLLMLIPAWPLVASGQLGMETRTTFLSLAVVLVTSFVILLFRQKLFSLPRRQLWMIAGIHMGRIVALVALLATMWHLALPDVGFMLWFVLATLRMLISRLPFLPNKDVVFPALAVFLLGRDAEMTNLIAMIGLLLTITHVIVGGALALADVFTPGTPRK